MRAILRARDFAIYGSNGDFLGRLEMRREVKNLIREEWRWQKAGGNALPGLLVAKGNPRLEGPEHEGFIRQP